MSMRTEGQFKSLIGCRILAGHLDRAMLWTSGTHQFYLHPSVQQVLPFHMSGEWTLTVGQGRSPASAFSGNCGNYSWYRYYPQRQISAITNATAPIRTETKPSLNDTRITGS